MGTSLATKSPAESGPITTEAMLYIALLWPLFRRSIERCAEKLSRNLDDQDDLVQVAMITLWRSDPTAYDFLLPGDVAFLKKVMKDQMKDVYGRHRTRIKERAAEGGPRNLYRRRIIEEETSFALMPASHIRALIAQIEGR